MESSSNYSDLKEPGLRKKKKKGIERGENSRYDAGRADKALSDTSAQMARSMAKRMGVKRG